MTTERAPELRVALISGPQYDQVGPALESFSATTGIPVRVGFRGDHASLNAHLADALPAGTYDLVSTHTKYAPSQARWLATLTDPPAGTFRPGALDLARFRGRLICLPRNIDVRLLWMRTDMPDLQPERGAPATWADLLDRAAAVVTATGGRVAGFAFPARGSGLFGTFFELAVSFGAALFDPDGAARLESSEAKEALGWLVEAHRVRRVTPAGMGHWYFDEVSAGFRSGQVAMVGDWPGYYRLLVEAGLQDRVVVARYPSGPAGRAVYAGCHAYAVTTTSARPDEALSLLRHLTSGAAAHADAGQGMVPAGADVGRPAGHALDARRAELLDLTVAEDMLTFPPDPAYPELEEAVAPFLAAALAGDLDPPAALAAAQRAAPRPHA